MTLSWSAIPTDRVAWYEDQVMWLGALEAAGVENNEELIDEARKIFNDWKKEDLELSNKIVEAWEKDQNDA